MFNLYHICLLRAFEHIHMEFARYKCLLLLLLLLLLYLSQPKKIVVYGRTSLFTLYHKIKHHHEYQF